MAKRGFSLIEVIMVILIAGILAIFLASDLSSSLSTAKLSAAQFKVKSDIIYAQNLAVTQQVNHGVIFDPSLETYSVYSQTTGNIVNNPLTGAAFTVNFNTDSDLRGVDIVSANFGAPSINRVEFDSFGTPSNGAVALPADGTVDLGYSGLSAVVRVTKNTGMVE
ncbi:MAG: prepilin-type N-terminal cleavage/methylation domain-containing protein [Candidatus Omnitrophica bacterium]|jgi:prepilin-type N-terminal cleavage/methylation domain-containing protein|nr:prepilin-type N-terminal cleavage/methylation domain-containing protein [Candidatus Omnitrophota bacterium]